MSMDDGKGVRIVEWSDATCEVSVRIEGDVSFNGDFTEFASISPGGLVRIRELGGGTDRLLEVRPGAGGLQYVYRESGREVAFDADARRWLGGFVQEVLRSGIAAEQRAAWLIRERGVDGLLAEVPALRGDRTQRLYLDALLASGPLAPAELVRAVDVADAELKSDRELGSFLSGLGTRDLGDTQVRRAYLRATASIESDREVGSVLMGLMDRESLDAADLELVLESCQGIQSDRELAGVLLRVLEEGPVEGRVRDSFMRGLETIQSDREYGRVASALLRSGTGG